MGENGISREGTGFHGRERHFTGENGISGENGILRERTEFNRISREITGFYWRIRYFTKENYLATPHHSVTACFGDIHQIVLTPNSTILHYLVTHNFRSTPFRSFGIIHNNIALYGLFCL